jgi:hypothetical protein
MGINRRALLAGAIATGAAGVTAAEAKPAVDHKPKRPQFIDQWIVKHGATAVVVQFRKVLALTNTA